MMCGLTDVKAAILAGGLGTRLRPVVADRPKVLAPVRGRPFLCYLLDQLVEASVVEVVLCTGYRGELVRKTLGDEYRGMRLSYSQEASPLGTGGALRLALPNLNSETILVMNGDSYCETDLQALCAWHRQKQASATLLVTEAPDAARYGRVEMDGEGRIVRFEEKSVCGGPGWINAGIYVVQRVVLDEIPSGRPLSLEKEVFPTWVGRGLYGHKNQRGRFLDIGTPQSYALAEAFFSSFST